MFVHPEKPIAITPRPPVELIINADDLGCSEAVNAAVFHLMAGKFITSATLLANGPAIADAVALVSRYPGCSFGAHLNITAFRPLSRARGLAPLLDAEGCFISHQIRKVSIDSPLAHAIYEEWDAQIGFLRSCGVPVSHLDSHHHVHTIPRLFPVLKRVQARHGIRRVRISMNFYPGNERVSPFLLMKKRIWNTALRHYGHTATTEGFSDLVTFHQRGREVAPGRRTFELMVHPGDAGRAAETAMLGGGWREELRIATRLISYRELS